MPANASELSALRTVASRLGELRREVMFVGGMIRSLLITDAAAPAARATDDIDLVASIRTHSEYHALSTRLRARGFREDTREHAPLCRWQVDGLTVDVMPDHANVLGFSNDWYVSAGRTATWHSIGSRDDETIRVVDAPHFVATKLASFQGRGAGDFYHHDVEDIVAVVDGRIELLTEASVAPEALREYLAREIEALLANDSFVDAVPGHLAGDRASQARLPLVLDRLRALSALVT